MLCIRHAVCPYHLLTHNMAFLEGTRAILISRQSFDGEVLFSAIDQHNRGYLARVRTGWARRPRSSRRRFANACRT